MLELQHATSVQKAPAAKAKAAKRRQQLRRRAPAFTMFHPSSHACFPTPKASLHCLTMSQHNLTPPELIQAAPGLSFVSPPNQPAGFCY